MSNESRRQRAKDYHLPTFRYEVTEDWTACTDCGSPIRRTAHVGRPGMWRLCDCQGVVWVSRHIVGDGWEKRREDEL